MGASPEHVILTNLIERFLAQFSQLFKRVSCRHLDSLVCSTANWKVIEAILLYVVRIFSLGILTKKMIFSRDAIQAKIASLNQSANERTRTLVHVCWLNLGIGCVFLLMGFFTSSHWGSGATFQSISTALLHLGLTYAVLEWLKQPDIQKVDLIGGAFLVLLLLLLQTTILWGSFAGGFSGAGNSFPCFLNGSQADKAVSILAGILLTSNLFLALAAFKWRADWDKNNFVSTGYSVLPQATGASLERTRETSKRHPVDEEVEGGL